MKLTLAVWFRWHQQAGGVLLTLHLAPNLEEVEAPLTGEVDCLALCLGPGQLPDLSEGVVVDLDIRSHTHQRV